MFMCIKPTKNFLTIQIDACKTCVLVIRETNKIDSNIFKSYVTRKHISQYFTHFLGKKSFIRKHRVNATER